MFADKCSIGTQTNGNVVSVLEQGLKNVVSKNFGLLSLKDSGK